jgi:hypothetical protein
MSIREIDTFPIPQRRERKLAFELGEQHVSAHRGEALSDQMRRAIVAAREQVNEGRPCAACPAAQVLGVTPADGLTVRCSVERSLITERESPSSLANFCLHDAGDSHGGYTACSTWRAEKERVWHGRRMPLVPASEGV